MHFQNQIPVRLGHLGKADIAQDAGVIDNDIHRAKGIQCGLDDTLAMFNRVIIGDCFTAECLDLFHHLVGSRRGLAAPGSGTTEIIHYYLCTETAEQQGMGTTQTTTGPGHDRNTTIKTQLAHLFTLLSMTFHP